MRKITIGRGRECDIRLKDDTDTVSRKHAVLAVWPSGKMLIYDLSSNGTSVNGVKVEKPNGYRVRRGDRVNFANLVDLDWSQVKNPYRTVNRILVGLVVLVVCAVVAVLCIPSLRDAVIPARENPEVNLDTEPAAAETAVPAAATEEVTVTRVDEQAAQPAATPRVETTHKDKQDSKSKAEVMLENNKKAKSLPDDKKAEAPKTGADKPAETLSDEDLQNK